MIYNPQIKLRIYKNIKKKHFYPKFKFLNKIMKNTKSLKAYLKKILSFNNKIKNKNLIA